MTIEGTVTDDVMFRIFSSDKQTNVDIITVFDIMVEEGFTSSPWTPAAEDNLQSSVNNNFSWQFSPTYGIKMWTGS
jgi:hypothetical protein